MAKLTTEQVSYLRGHYERLPNPQPRIFVPKPELCQLRTEELKAILEYNDASPETWPTFTDLESHIRNICQLRSYGVPITLY